VTAHADATVAAHGLQLFRLVAAIHKISSTQTTETTAEKSAYKVSQ
jgi:hypothetical protein